MADIDYFFGEQEDHNEPAAYVSRFDSETGSMRVLAGATALSTHDLETLSRWTHERHVCVWCTRAYYEIDNIGVWRCRQHVCPLVGGHWTCCQREMRGEGCVSAHHRSKPGAYRDDEPPLAISLSLARRLANALDAATCEPVAPRLSEGSVLVDEHAIVRRYDAAASNAIFELRRPLEELYLESEPRRRMLERLPRALRTSR